MVEHVPPSQVVFALLMAAVGAWGFAQSDFVAIWVPGIRPAEMRAVMVYACSLVSVIAGLGLLRERFRIVSARLLLGFLCLWLIWCKGPPLVRAPGELVAFESLSETLVPAAAALAISGVAFGVVAARLLYGLALIAFGAAHLGYLAETASLVPAWLPWHEGWVYLTAATYVAAGIALLIARFARQAAALSAVQMALFGLLVWLPKVAAGALDRDTLNEAAISFALAASGWVVASALADQSRARDGPARELAPSSGSINSA